MVTPLPFYKGYFRELVCQTAFMTTDHSSTPVCYKASKGSSYPAIMFVLRLSMFSLISISAFAAGGTCPSGANYLNPSGTLVTLSSLGVTNCYFVSAAGADTNNGTSESTPWLHAPQMPNCSGTCATVQNQNGGIPPGTGIILRGGDTWHFGNSSATPYTGGTWEWNNGQTPNGTSSHPLYVGVDQSWYSGSSWARPILTADNPLCNANTANGTTCISTTDWYGQPSFYVNSCAYQIGSTNDFIDTTFRQYYIIDNLEMIGLCQSDTGQPGHHDVYMSYGSAQAPLTFQNLYMHGWSHLPFAAKNGSTGCTASTVCINIYIFNGSVINGSVGESVHYNVVDGSDSDPGGAGLCFGGFYDVAYNVFRYTTQCIPNPLHLFHDNLYEYFFENGHSNMLESLNDVAGTNAIYNNVFRHIETFVTSGGGVGMWLTPPPGTTDYIFNNLMYDVGNMEYINVGSSGQNFGNETYFNNTFQTNPNQPIFRCETLIGGALNDTNNHFIDDGTQYLGPCSTLTTTTPLAQTNAQADANSPMHFDQYTASEIYGFSPVASTNSTVGTGTNEYSGYCRALSTAGLSAAATACQSDISYACSYAGNGAPPVCPGRTANARPTSGAWDVAAYEYNGQGAPLPPTGLTAVPY